jgi:hypothetical protein
MDLYNKMVVKILSGDKKGNPKPLTIGNYTAKVFLVKKWQ